MTSAHEQRSDPVGLAAAAHRDRMEILRRAAVQGDAGDVDEEESDD